MNDAIEMSWEGVVGVEMDNKTLEPSASRFRILGGGLGSCFSVKDKRVLEFLERCLYL